MPLNFSISKTGFILLLYCLNDISFIYVTRKCHKTKCKVLFYMQLHERTTNSGNAKNTSSDDRTVPSGSTSATTSTCAQHDFPKARYVFPIIYMHKSSQTSYNFPYCPITLSFMWCLPNLVPWPTN